MTADCKECHIMKSKQNGGVGNEMAVNLNSVAPENVS